MRFVLFALCLAFTFSAQAQSPVAPEAKLQLLADGFKFTEGPSCDAEGNVYFTDQPNDRIHVWSVDGKLSTFLEPAGRSNGLCFDKKGRLLACADEKNELWRIDVKTKKHEVIVKDFNGKLLNGPNDVWVRPDGGIYFTDPYFKRSYWKRGPAEQDAKSVYFLAADGKALKRVTGDIFPNGVVGTPDGKTLYVAASGIQAFDIQPDGSLANQRKFCSDGADGLTLDAEGNLYLAGKGVIIYDKSGKKIETIAVPQPWTANVCFGGRDRKMLFITASRAIYGLQMRVKGEPQ
ncbi:MAG: SMP-30/gluconolactonase/LRE family protein [Gemmataceae bacterium]